MALEIKSKTKAPKLKLPKGLSVLFNDLEVAGLQHSGIFFEWYCKEPGVELFAFFDPNNPYDSNAIAICHESCGNYERIGHVDAGTAKMISRLPQEQKDNLYIRGKEKLHGIITDRKWDDILEMYDEDEREWYKCTYDILLHNGLELEFNPYEKLVKIPDDFSKELREDEDRTEKINREFELKRKALEIKAYAAAKEKEEMLRRQNSISHKMITSFKNVGKGLGLFFVAVLTIIALVKILG